MKRACLLPPDKRSSERDTQALHQIPDHMHNRPTQVDVCLLTPLLQPIPMCMPFPVGVTLLRMTVRVLHSPDENLQYDACSENVCNKKA